MKIIGLKLGLAAILLVMLNISAWGTIEKIKGTLNCSIGCNNNIIQLIAPGRKPWL
jgi:hypothetical protein